MFKCSALNSMSLVGDCYSISFNTWQQGSMKSLSLETENLTVSLIPSVPVRANAFSV